MTTFAKRLDELMYEFRYNKTLMRNDIRVTQKYYLHEDNELLLNEVNRAISQT